MSTSKMPARIWLINGHVYSPTVTEKDVPGIAYIRADIVERMAEALNRAEHLYSIGLLNASDGLADQVVALRRSALTSYREAINDKA